MFMLIRDRGAFCEEYRTEKRLPEPCGKGVGAEVSAVAGT